MRTCQRSGNSSAGFTLLELLIVLALIAVASVFSVAAVDRLAGRVAERRWSDLTQQTLAKLRNKAVTGGVVVSAIVDFDGGALLPAGTDNTDRLLVLPETSRFVSSSSTGSSSTLPLYFYPDGTMDEAVFDLALPSEGRRRFRMARFAGKIERTTVNDVRQ